MEDFVRNISSYTSGEAVWSKRFDEIWEVLQRKDVYKTIVLNEFIPANGLSMFMKLIKHMIE